MAAKAAGYELLPTNLSSWVKVQPLSPQAARLVGKVGAWVAGMVGAEVAVPLACEALDLLLARFRVDVIRPR